jgi:hypothetical protein
VTASSCDYPQPFNPAAAWACLTLTSIATGEPDGASPDARHSEGKVSAIWHC